MMLYVHHEASLQNGKTLDLSRFSKIVNEIKQLPLEKLQVYLKSSVDSGQPFDQYLETNKILTQHEVLKVFSQYYGVPAVKIDDLDIPKSFISLIPKELAVKYKAIPIDRAGNIILIATSMPRDLAMLDSIRHKTGYTAKAAFASHVSMTLAVKRHYQTMVEVGSDAPKDGVALKARKARTKIEEDSVDENQVIRFVNQVLLQCLNQDASDIHFEPYESEIRVRLRIDGVLSQVATPPLSMKAALTSRIKIMANMNIAESRLPQDGAINVQIGDKPVDFRVNTIPTVHGEKIVLRILDKSALNVDMSKLGFEKDQLEIFLTSIQSPFGMVLVTGPTGSGKTTTLYSALTELNREGSNIMTAEDPVEYSIGGINQVQMKSDIGLNFSSALRAFLRQDPDIIMVGEIRDKETAEIGVKAALTGHLVISTLHTNSAPETITRLLNMGVEGFNLVSALNCITAQRLLRLNCQHCSAPDPEVTPELLKGLGFGPTLIQSGRFMKGKGCQYCNGKGTKGRIGVHEVLPITDAIKNAIIAGEPVMKLKQIAEKDGMRSLRNSALMKFSMGIVPLHEVIRVTSE